MSEDDRRQISFRETANRPRHENDAELTVTWDGNRLLVEVEDEHAVDSYNSMFNSQIVLSAEQARELARFLASCAPEPPR